MGQRSDPQDDGSCASLSSWGRSVVDWATWLDSHPGFACSLNIHGVCQTSSRMAAELVGRSKLVLKGMSLAWLEPSLPWPGAPGICQLSDWLPLVRVATGPVEFRTVWLSDNGTPGLFHCRAGRLRSQATDGSSLYLIAQRVIAKTPRTDSRGSPASAVPVASQIPADLVRSIRNASHELNNLLTAAYCINDSLLSAVQLPPQVLKSASDFHQILDEISTLGAELRRSILGGSDQVTNPRNDKTRSTRTRESRPANPRVDRLLPTTVNR